MTPGRAPGSARLATYFHVHLVSDSTGETLNAMAKAVTARFDGVIPIEHIYALVRAPRQMERVLEEMASAPGVVLHTIVDRELREQLETGCRHLDMPQIGALDPLVKEMLYVAVSVVNGCEYCIHSHSAAARSRGMTDAQYGELLSVIAMASQTNALATALQVRTDAVFLKD